MLSPSPLLYPDQLIMSDVIYRPSRILRCCDLQHQRNISQSPQMQGGVAILTNHRNFPANLTNHWLRKAHSPGKRQGRSGGGGGGHCKARGRTLPSQSRRTAAEEMRPTGAGADSGGGRRLDDPHNTEPPYRNPPG